MGYADGTQMSIDVARLLLHNYKIDQQHLIERQIIACKNEKPVMCVIFNQKHV